MADQNRDREIQGDEREFDSSRDRSQNERDAGSSSRSDNSEWLRDQVGEDHNLSGSSTYRTLPDQPEGEESDQDSSDRQSNR